MLNLIKMDFYRMHKYKHTWIILVIMAILSFISAFVTKIVGSESEITIFSLIATIIQNGNMCLLLIIANVIRVNGNYSTGYIKNLAGKYSKRFKFTISSLIVSSVFCIMLFVSVILSSIIGGKIFIKNIQFGDGMEFISFIIFEILLYLAFSAFTIMIVSILKSTGFSMALLIIYIYILETLFIVLADLFLTKILKLNTDFSLADISITQKIASLPIKFESSAYLKSAIFAVVLFGITSLVSMYSVSRSDIK